LKGKKGFNILRVNAEVYSIYTSATDGLLISTICLCVSCDFLWVIGSKFLEVIFFECMGD